MPPEVLLATQTYREEMDLFGQFPTDCCILGPMQRATTEELYQAYGLWCTQNGIHYQPTKPQFGRWLGERGFTHSPRQGNKQSWGWRSSRCPRDLAGAAPCPGHDATATDGVTTWETLAGDRSGHPLPEPPEAPERRAKPVSFWGAFFRGTLPKHPALWRLWRPGPSLFPLLTASSPRNATYLRHHQLRCL